MSPLISAPNRGYADWQRVANMDTGALVSINRGATRASDDSGVLDVSRFEYLGGQDHCLTTPVLVTMFWFADAAGLVTMGSRQFTLHQLVANPAQYRLPNLGPFVEIQWASISGDNFAHQATLIATNRFHPLEFIPIEPLLIDASAVAIGGAANATVFTSDFYAGPVECVVSSVGGATSFVAQALDTAGVARTLSPTVTPAANTFANLNFVAPPGAWFITALNPGAATSYSITAVPSMTGSS